KIVSDLVVPAISSVSKGILAFVKSADGLKFISSLAGSIAAGFTILQNVLSVLYNVIKDSILKAFTDIKERMEQTTSANEMLTGGLNFLKGIVIALSVAFNIAVNTIKLVTIAIIDLAEVVKTAGELLGQIFTGQWDKVGESAKKVGEKFKNLTINLKDNFGDIVNGAIETANKIDKGFDVKKIADDTKKSFNDVKNNVENSLKSINTTVAESNDIIKDDILIFTNELKKAYEEYVSLKKDLVEKNYKNEQEYFDKLNKLNELQKIKGIKELEDYYSKKNDVVKKNEESLLQQISKTLQGFNFGNFIKDVEDEMGKLINSVINATSQISVAFVKMAADIKDNWKKINESNLSETEKNIEKMKLLFGSIGTAVGSVFNAIGGIVSGSMNYYTKQIEAEISAIENKYKGLFDSLDKTREDNLKKIDEDLEKELEAIGIRNETELEQAQSRLEQLQELERNFRDVEAEERLARLEEYYASIQSQTDEEIRLAYERQKAKILEGEEKKKIDLQEQISTQQKEVAKLQAIENANKKKLELEQQYEAKKKELEKQRIAELNAKEQQIFEANKANQIANVWIATGVGIAT
ncbi:MAG: hypothetical protein GYA14_06875, partial [Ignavibacteria bacterium]|nr:hypothetical protein [Ignavibacteria bacterium]